ncbi:MAG TPA: hypothetical protein VNR65_10815, partial [Geobacterales bacterium]|nr:hypothetical protein [Geobacterales bacterium]
MPDLLSRLISEETLCGVVVEYIRDDGLKPEIAAFGLSGFISDACANEYLASPGPHFEFTLLDRALKQKPAFLS